MRTPARTVSLDVESIASGGDGVGRSNGLVVFVPRTAPGDRVTASISGKGQQHFARGSLVSIVQPSPDRVAPPCPHYTTDSCGGCQLQHIEYVAQLAAKRRIISDAMHRIGKREVDVLPVQPSPSEWRYRTKLTLAVRRTANGWIAGLRAYNNPSRVFPLSDCLITDRRVVAAWREVLAASQFFPDTREFRGSVRWTDDGPIFVVIGGTRWSAHEEFFEAVPTLSALFWEPEHGERMVMGDRRTTLGNARRPGASFAQVNPRVAEELRAYVVQRVGAYQPKTVVDAYAGSGDLSAILADGGIRVTAIELDSEGADWARSRLPASATVVTARVEDVLADHLPADIVVFNPPRAGLHESIPELVQYGEPRAILYVSCDPATLARDVGRLAKYRIASMRAFDMFPQTSHVETVCELVLDASHSETHDSASFEISE